MCQMPDCHFFCVWKILADNYGGKRKKTPPVELLLAYMYLFVYITAYFLQKIMKVVGEVFFGGDGWKKVCDEFDEIDCGLCFDF